MMAAFHSPKPFPYGGMCQKRAAYRKSVLPMRVGNARGSAHETAFALQLHKQSGHAPDCLYFEREKVPIWELFLFRSINSQAHVLTVYAVAMQMLFHAHCRAHYRRASAIRFFDRLLFFDTCRRTGMVSVSGRQPSYKPSAGKQPCFPAEGFMRIRRFGMNWSCCPIIHRRRIHRALSDLR